MTFLTTECEDCMKKQSTTLIKRNAEIASILKKLERGVGRSFSVSINHEMRRRKQTVICNTLELSGVRICHTTGTGERFYS